MPQPHNNVDIENVSVKKASADHEERMVGNMSREDQEVLNNFSVNKQKRAVRKVDIISLLTS